MLRKRAASMAWIYRGCHDRRASLCRAVGFQIGRCQCTGAALAREARPSVFISPGGRNCQASAELRGALRRRSWSLFATNPAYAGNPRGFDRSVAARRAACFTMGNCSRHGCLYSLSWKKILRVAQFTTNPRDDNGLLQRRLMRGCANWFATGVRVLRS